MKRPVLSMFLCISLIAWGHISAASIPSYSEDCNWSSPQNVRDSLRGATSLYVNWDAPVSGIPPGGYRLSVYQSTSGALVFTQNTTALSALVTGLKAGTFYDIDVSSVCANGVPGPAARLSLPTIIVEFIVNGEGNLICAEPTTHPNPTTSEIFNPDVPACSGVQTNYCAGIYYPFAEFSTSNSIQIYNFKLTFANKYYWFALERRPDGYYRIKELGKSNNVNSQLEASFFTIRIGTLKVAQVGFYSNYFHLTRKSTYTVSAIIDLFSQCNPFLLDAEMSLVHELIETKESNFCNANKKSNDEIICIPNPAFDFINIKLPYKISGKAKIRLTTIEGAVLWEDDVLYKNDNDQTIHVDIDMYMTGTYAIILEDDRAILYSFFTKL